MAIRISDPSLVAGLLQADGIVEICDASGQVLGQFVAEGLCKLPPGVKSPFTEEELVKRRKDRSGRSLVEILHDLKAREQ